MASCKLRKEERNGGLKIWSPGPAASASLGNWAEVGNFVMRHNSLGFQPGLLVLCYAQKFENHGSRLLVLPACQIKY